MTRLALALCVFLVASANARPRRKRIFKVYSRDEIGDSNGSLERLTGGRGLQKNKKNKDGDMASAWESMPSLSPIVSPTDEPTSMEPSGSPTTSYPTKCKGKDCTDAPTLPPPTYSPSTTSPTKCKGKGCTDAPTLPPNSDTTEPSLAPAAAKIETASPTLPPVATDSPIAAAIVTASPNSPAPTPAPQRQIPNEETGEEDTTVTTSTVVTEVSLTTEAAVEEIEEIITTDAPAPPPQEQAVVFSPAETSEPLPPTAGAMIHATTLAFIALTITLFFSA
ncbi:hypothetical protein THAOC_16976 [Thalassiosira oceanica]|uniref:Uncharacterized protein n=1 Tax=Thalassiosira oceanica TaxID=159749 RepID=K0SBU1_THAOC|nr:hypothetical protein THAOC_16976 [Thalassiosira oceanica]|eukprot:EJK62414.1 hypothetical protein THAOC_16976 [Thalassiosira oceanica]